MIKQKWFLYNNEIYSVRYTDFQFGKNNEVIRYITVYIPHINAWSSHYMDSEMGKVPDDMNVEDGEELNTVRLDEEIKKKRMLLQLKK